MIACRCGAPDEETCRCWETGAAKYDHLGIKSQTKLDELWDKWYGQGKDKE